MTEEQVTKIINKIHSTNLPNMLKNEFMFFCITFPMADKNIYTFLKMSSKAATIGYLYKHLVKTAIKQNVPRVYISEYFKIKELVNHKWYKDERNENIRKMQDSSIMLLRATRQMDSSVNSRKMKIKKIKEEIELNELKSI